MIQHSNKNKRTMLTPGLAVNFWHDLSHLWIQFQQYLNQFILSLNHMNVRTGWRCKDSKHKPSVVKSPGSFHLFAKTGRKLGQRQTSLYQSLLHEMTTQVYINIKLSLNIWRRLNPREHVLNERKHYNVVSIPGFSILFCLKFTIRFQSAPSYSLIHTMSEIVILVIYLNSINSLNY